MMVSEDERRIQRSVRSGKTVKHLIQYQEYAGSNPAINPRLVKEMPSAKTE